MKKSDVFLVLGIISALFSLIMLAFNLWGASYYFIKLGQSGFDTLKGNYMGEPLEEIFDSSFLAVFCKVFTIMVIIVSVLLCVFVVVAYVKRKNMKKVSLCVNIISIVLSILYFVLGIVLMGRINLGTLSKTTAAFWPSILQLLFLITIVLCDKFIKNNVNEPDTNNLD